MATTTRFAAHAEENDDVNKTDQQKEDDEKARIQRMRVALGCLASYFIIGWIAYCFIFESWTFTTATFFLMVTLTTVGYGVPSPTSQSSRLFTLFFVLFGISIVAVALVEVANYFMEKREALLKKTQADVIKNAADNSGKESSSSKKGGQTSGVYAKLKAFLSTHPVINVTGNLVCFALIFGAIYAGIESWPLTDGIYFTIVTGTTVGYGDLVPSTTGGMWWSVLFLPFAVIFVSTNLSELASILLGKAEDSKLKSLLEVDLSLEALLSMDADGDGEITEFEFIKFMMTSAGMVDEETLDSLHGRFQEMDADGSGSLTRDDILVILKEKEEKEEAAEREKNSAAGLAEVRLGDGNESSGSALLPTDQ